MVVSARNPEPHTALALQSQSFNLCPMLAFVLMCYMCDRILAKQTPGRLLLMVSPLTNELSCYLASQSRTGTGEGLHPR